MLLLFFFTFVNKKLLSGASFINCFIWFEDRTQDFLLLYPLDFSLRNDRSLQNFEMSIFSLILKVVLNIE
jgi:hypothetical protein